MAIYQHIRHPRIAADQSLQDAGDQCRVLGGPGVNAIVPVLTWLVGPAAVWLLWRPASSAFFKPQRFV